MDKKKNKNDKKVEESKKSPFVTFCVCAVAIILTLSVCTCILIFLTNGVIEVDVDSNSITTNFDRVSVSTIIEELTTIEWGEPAEEEEEEPEEPEQQEPEKINLAIYGDSISTYEGMTQFNVTYPQEGNDVDSVGKTWWQLVAEGWGAYLISNSSSSGSNVMDNINRQYNGCDDERIAAVDSNSDIILVFMGMNDYWEASDLDGFAAAYTEMLGKLQAQAPNAEIKCMTIYATSFDDNSAHQSGHQVTAYNAKIEACAQAAGCGIIDLSVLDMTKDDMTFETDVHVHPTAKGMQAIADVVLGSYTPSSSSGGSTTTPVADINHDAESIMNFLVDAGYSKSAAAGICGNLYAESHLDPAAKSASGYRGIAQWDPKSRWPACESWCKANNYDPETLIGQLNFLLYEATTNQYPGYCSPTNLSSICANTGHTYRNVSCTDAEYASYIWVRFFERAVQNGGGGSYGNKSTYYQAADERAAYAKQYYDAYK